MKRPVRTPSNQKPSSKAEGRSKFKSLSSWLAFGANLVTIAGLAVVIFELNQSQKMTRSQTRHEISAGIVTLLFDTANNQQLTDVIYRGSQGAQLTPTEQYQFDMRSNALLRYWEDVHYQYRMGLYDQEEFDRQRGAWGAVLRDNQGFRAYWCRVRTLYSPSFADAMNHLLPPEGCAHNAQRNADQKSGLPLF